jgi:hypothetical protein
MAVCKTSVIYPKPCYDNFLSLHGSVEGTPHLHGGSDGFPTHTLMPTVWAHASCHGDKIVAMKKDANVTPPEARFGVVVGCLMFVAK